MSASSLHRESNDSLIIAVKVIGKLTSDLTGDIHICFGS